jgi:4-carboxymuconolactone decarboxylase
LPDFLDRPFGGVAPKLAETAEHVLFGDIWERPGLTKRDRCLITIGALVASYRPLQLPFYMNYALQNGVTRDELGELLTHVSFYAGFPAAITAADALAEVLADSPPENSA